MNTLVYELEYIPVDNKIDIRRESAVLLPIGLISNQVLSLLSKQVKVNSGLNLYISNYSTFNKTVLYVVKDNLMLGRIFITVDKVKSEIVDKIETIFDLIEQQIKRDIKNN